MSSFYLFPILVYKKLAVSDDNVQILKNLSESDEEMVQIII